MPLPPTTTTIDGKWNEVFHTCHYYLCVDDCQILTMSHEQVGERQGTHSNWIDTKHLPILYLRKCIVVVCSIQCLLYSFRIQCTFVRHRYRPRVNRSISYYFFCWREREFLVFARLIEGGRIEWVRGNCVLLSQGYWRQLGFIHANVTERKNDINLALLIRTLRNHGGDTLAPLPLP